MLDNPNSVQQMKDWLAANGLQTDTLGKNRSPNCLRPRLSRSSLCSYCGSSWLKAP